MREFLSLVFNLTDSDTRCSFAASLPARLFGSLLHFLYRTPNLV